MKVKLPTVSKLDPLQPMEHIASHFHYRDGSLQHDGSRGRIEITYDELVAALKLAAEYGTKLPGKCPCP